MELSEPGKINELAFGKKALEFVEHLSNIGGFCNSHTQSAIWSVIRNLTAMVLAPNDLFTKTMVKLLVPMAIGIQVDFTRTPFRVLGLDVKAFSAGVKGVVKR